MAASSSTQTACLLEPIEATQPPDLETDDPHLATVILPAPPPLSSVIAQRKDYHSKRPLSLFSYLPASDPGTTYTGLMGGLGLNLVPEDEGRLRKRARIDKRSYRSSARSINTSLSHNFFPKVQAEQPMEQMDYTLPMRHTESLLTESDDSSQDNASIGAVRKGRDNDKTKDKEPMKVKEESQGLNTVEVNLPVGHLNDDHCSACRSNGGLLYCDGCPRSFHLWCLDPPMDAQDVPEGDKLWFCPSCIIKQNPPSRPRRSFFAPLLHQLQHSIPTEFELPEDIRNFFKDVTTGPKGSYQDAGETKLSRISRFNVLEERDAFRLKDKNGGSVLCFRCKKSALPNKDALVSLSTRELRNRRAISATLRPDDLWKSVISCDYCSLHWHLDCLDPPLAAMPPAHKKWMCPVHIDHALPKRRVPRHSLPVTDIMNRNEPNNGNIEVIPVDTTEEKKGQMNFDEVHINGRRYRIPERVIVLDFWDKLHCANPPKKPSDLLGLSSPLTSLSSLEDSEKVLTPNRSTVTPKGSQIISKFECNDPETIEAVELLMACKKASSCTSRDSRTDTDKAQYVSTKVDKAIQTELVYSPVSGCGGLKGHDSVRSAIPNEVEASSMPHSIIQAKSPSQASRSRTTNILRPSQSNPLSPKPFRKQTSHSFDTGPKRLTRSRTKLSQGSYLAQKSFHTEAGSTASRRITRGSRSLLESNNSNASLHTKISPGIELGQSAPSPNSKLKSLHVESSRCSQTQEAFKSNVKSGSSISLSPTKSPFKIRIPRAINTAVAAATAAAAATRPVVSETSVDGPTSYKLFASGSASDSSLTTESFGSEDKYMNKGKQSIETRSNSSEGSTLSSLL